MSLASVRPVSTHVAGLCEAGEALSDKTGVTDPGYIYFERGDSIRFVSPQRQF